MSSATGMWVACDVVAGSVAAGASASLTGRPQHVVSLVSIKVDARDERLQMVWELERVQWPVEVEIDGLKRTIPNAAGRP